MNVSGLTVDEFFGARSGRAVGDEGQPIELVTSRVGALELPSGMLGVVDPFASLDGPLAVTVGPGTYPVMVTHATYPQDDPHDWPEEPEDVMTGTAYLSVVLRDGEPASIEPLPGTMVDGLLYGVTTWGGYVGFVDATAAEGHQVTPESDLFDDWLTTAGEHPQGLLDAPLPWAAHDENVIAVTSPDDEGEYPLYLTRDAGGEPLAIHIDFLIVGEDRHELEVHEWPPGRAPATI